MSPEPRQTWVVVREGEAAVMLPGGPQQVLPGQTANIAGVQGAVAEVRAGAGIDGLDTWSAERDRVYERGRETVAYVSRQMVGYADLETQGRWQSYPDYGAVWFPNTVVADWAPYRYGHWVWLARYGWTWVDDASWGYAPFHYGRWANIGGRWGWCPGTFVARPIWAPALVAWYGGSGWSYSASVGGPVFGWIPLGWRRSVRAVVGPLLEPLLRPLQPPLCGERRRASAPAADVLRQRSRPRRHHRRARCRIARHAARSE